MQASKDDKRAAFLAVYEALREEIMADPTMQDQPENAQAWMRKMLDYNVPGGKLNRGMAVLDALKAVQKTASLTEQQQFEANLVGWGIELLQAYFLVADDIMDNSITRRGQPCWYRVPQVGMVAVNDGIILEACIYKLLKAHFRGRPFYADLMDLFHDMTYLTAQGQMLDLITAPIGTVDLSRYTLPTYMRIVTYKTAYYSFYLPVAAGLLLGGVTNDKAFELAKDLCVQMGQYFQIQDDYLDCYGDPSVIGKVGTDIEDNKCSWLVVQALQRADDQQRAVIEECYGRSDKESVERVKAVYRDMDLEAVFKSYETHSHERLTAAIAEQQLLPPEVFSGLLAKIYKRTK